MSIARIFAPALALILVTMTGAIAFAPAAELSDAELSRVSGGLNLQPLRNGITRAGIRGNGLSRNGLSRNGMPVNGTTMSSETALGSAVLIGVELAR